MAKTTKKVGRPSKYNDKYCEDIIEFFSIPTTYEEEITNVNKKTGEEFTTYVEKANQLPTFEGFAKKISVDTDTLMNWTKEHASFAQAYARCKQLQKDFLVQNALLGHYNTAFSIFLAKNITDLRDKVENNVSIQTQEPLKIEIVE